MLLIITHFHLIGALSSASFGCAGPMTFHRPRQLSVAANQSGVLPFLRRVAILHSHKALTLAALYFSMRHVDIFGRARTNYLPPCPSRFQASFLELNGIL